MWFSEAGIVYRALDIRSSVRRYFETSNIGTVDREARRDFNQRVQQCKARQLTGIAIVGRNLRQFPSQSAHFYGQKRAHDDLLLLIQNVGKLRLPASEIGID